MYMVLKRTRFAFWKKKGGGNDNLCVVSLMDEVTSDHSLVGNFRLLPTGQVPLSRVPSLFAELAPGHIQLLTDYHSTERPQLNRHTQQRGERISISFNCYVS